MYFSQLFPRPMSCVENQSERFVFGASVQAVISGLTSECIKRVKALWNSFSCTASELNVVSAEDGFRFVIGNTKAILSESDSYAIHADTMGVCVAGKDASSLMNGTVICPWDNRENIRSLSADVAKYGAYGLIMTTWHHLPNFLNSAGYWGNCAWSAGQNAIGSTGNVSASFLRKLYCADGNFERAGWGNCEVEF